MDVPENMFLYFNLIGNVFVIYVFVKCQVQPEERES